MPCTCARRVLEHPKGIVSRPLNASEAMSEGIEGFTPYMIIDTGRNGVAGMRSKCATLGSVHVDQRPPSLGTGATSAAQGSALSQPPRPPTVTCWTLTFG